MTKIISFLKMVFSFWKLVKAMKRDAERYRHLRVMAGEGLDAEVDKQIARGKLS